MPYNKMMPNESANNCIAAAGQGALVHMQVAGNRRSDLVELVVVFGRAPSDDMKYPGFECDLQPNEILLLGINWHDRPMQLRGKITLVPDQHSCNARFVCNGAQTIWMDEQIPPLSEDGRRPGIADLTLETDVTEFDKSVVVKAVADFTVRAMENSPPRARRAIVTHTTILAVTVRQRFHRTMRS